MTENTVKTRILIISDTHCASLDGLPGSRFKRPLPSADLLIHCGDLTYTGKVEEYHKCLDMLKEIDAPTKLVIAGNHDKTLDRDFMLGHPYHYGGTQDVDKTFREIRDLWTAEGGRARKEGVTFLDEGMHTISLRNGARVQVYASPYTPEFCDWAFPYERYEDRFNAPDTSLSDAENISTNPVPSFGETKRPVDVLITHGPPYGRLDATRTGHLAGCPHLLRALMRTRPLVHCFGHIHEGSGAERLRWSDSADGVATKGTSTNAWTEREWKQGVEEVKAEAQEYGCGDDHPDNAALIGGSRAGGRALERGKETLLVNASIMTVRYRPENTPWLVDLDLPVAAPAT